MRPALPFSVARQTLSRRSTVTPFNPARFNSSSSTTDTAQKKAQEALAATQKKAQATLESAQKGSERAWAAALKYLGPLGDKAGNALGKYKEPLVYNTAVARELLKQIYISEALQPPTSRATITEAYRAIGRNALNKDWWRTAASNGEIGRVGIYALQAYGIFEIGEIIGRLHLVGYGLH